MKTLDAQNLHDGIAATVTEIESTQTKITNMQKAVRGVTLLEEDLKGKTGEAVRNFFNECHQPFLIYMYQFMIHYQETLEEMGKSVKSFEPMEAGFIKEEFLENNVEHGLDKVKRTTVDLTEKANSVMDDVADIISLPRLDPKDLFDSVQFGKKKEQSVVEQLHDLDEYQSNALDDILQELHTMENYVNDIAGKFKSGSISITDFKVESIEGLAEHKEMMDSIYHNGSKQTSKVRDPEDVEKPGEKVTDKDHHVTKVKSDDSDTSLDSGAPFYPIGDWANTGTGTLDYFKSFNSVRKGFKIEKYITKGGIEKYRVYHPEAVGMKPPKVMKTKLYESKYLDKEAKRGHHLKISKYVRPGSGAITALKSKVGWLGTGINAAENVYHNRNKGTVKIVGDLGVDVGIGAVSIAAAGATAAFVGALGAPVLVGAAAAIGVSTVASVLFDKIKVGKGKKKKSVSEHIKSGVQTIAGWFKK